MKDTVSEQTRTCRICVRVLPLDAFKVKRVSKAKGAVAYVQTLCRDCSNVQFNAWVKERRVALRTRVYAAYGNACACCGERDHRFLSIDHVANDGAKDRDKWRSGVSYTMYRQIIHNGFPDRFQLLCYNCNVGKFRNGGICPHQDSCSTAIPKGSTPQTYGGGSAGPSVDAWGFGGEDMVCSLQ